MPKIALISDVHANLSALKEVISKLGQFSPDQWVCLGDIVGYGPEPNACIDLIREKDMQCVLGNHDAGVAGLLSLNHFRNPNRRLIEQTSKLISPENHNWLSELPLVIEEKEWMAAHASPVEPNQWRYLESAFTVREILKAIKPKYCFVGHTHKPVLVSDQFGKRGISEEGKYLINPGSVGQSRDDDYRASCGLLDTEKNEYHNFRLEFDIEHTITSLIKLGYSFEEAKHLMRSR